MNRKPIYGYENKTTSIYVEQKIIKKNNGIVGVGDNDSNYKPKKCISCKVTGSSLYYDKN